MNNLLSLMMRKTIIPTTFLVLFFAGCGLQSADAQKMTEIYIPIGQSPGLAGYTKIGTVASVNIPDNTFILTDSLQHDYSVQLTDSTSIWLDRSRMKEQNRTGTIKDIQEGRLAEVKFYLAPDSTYLEAAEWVKIRITEPQ